MRRTFGFEWLRRCGALALALTCSVAAQAQTQAQTQSHGKVYYYYTDTLHSAVVETDAAGTVLERTYYAPFGSVLNRSLRNGLGYTGHEEDAATGLVYMQQRYYDPQAARFISVDPVQMTANGGNFNRYWYAKDNPYRYTDPDGRESGAGYATGEYALGLPRSTPEARDAALVMLSMAPVVGDAVNLHAAINDPSFSNVAIAVVGLAVPEAGAFGRVLKMRRAARAARLAENVAKGAKAEEARIAELGESVAGRRITLESSTGQRSVVDILEKDGTIHEVKAGPTARLSEGQKAIQDDVNAGRPVTPRG